jgi:hypothetical protein
VLGETLESLAGRLETGQPVTPVVRPDIEPPTGASAEEMLVYLQLAKVETEIEALTIAAQMPSADKTAVSVE